MMYWVRSGLGACGASGMSTLSPNNVKMMWFTSVNRLRDPDDAYQDRWLCAEDSSSLG